MEPQLLVGAFKSIDRWGLLPDPTSARSPAEQTNGFYRLVEQANVFILPNIAKSSTDQTIGELADKKIGLPFDVCWFEFLTTGALMKSESGEEVSVIGALLANPSPEQWFGYVVLAPAEKEKNHPPLYVRPTASETETRALATVLVQQLEASDLYQRSTHLNLRWKEGRHKNSKPIRKIIYVKPKRESTETNSDGDERIFGHRFECRGHWRRVKSIGKDRSGEYCIKGFTWVKDHIRGPEGLPLIKKTRVVVGSSCL